MCSALTCCCWKLSMLIIDNNLRCYPAFVGVEILNHCIKPPKTGTRRGLWREATTSSRAWISTRRLHLCAHTAHCA